MHGIYEHGINMPELPYPNMIDQTYPIYDGNFNAPYPRLSGPATHFDGVAFWYNPTNNDQLYDRDPNIFASRGAITPNAMDAASIKHRRTRSGCFTCRSRRVKVSKSTVNRKFRPQLTLDNSAMRQDQYVTVRLWSST